MQQIAQFGPGPSVWSVVVRFRSLMTYSSTYTVFSVPALEFVLQDPKRRCVGEPPQSFRHVRATAAPVCSGPGWTTTAGVPPPVRMRAGRPLAVSPPATPVPGSAFVVVTKATAGEDPTPPADPPFATFFYSIREKSVKPVARSPCRSSAALVLIVIQAVRRHRS